MTTKEAITILVRLQLEKQGFKVKPVEKDELVGALDLAVSALKKRLKT